MAQKFFVAVGVAAVVAILGGAAWTTFGAAGASRDGVPRTIAEIPITQHFSAYVGDVTGTPLQIMTPPTGGLALAQLTADDVGAGTVRSYLIRIGGAEVWRGRVSDSQDANGQGHAFVPALIVPPNTLLEISTPGYSAGTQTSLSGYVLSLSDFGL